ncbi:protein sawadee homeodomain homolog 1 [Phtheirospermum japonicum]|uniref:Protein sawadee homeodomain homolog 1 n=1 Tax=Phtheirospermum japonicum TaxID=374723 RepID=A0A830BA68_9LAMI|nr:protein sawadee homeodomain homolog 1 [Phtheirospermum japonicum]
MDLRPRQRQSFSGFMKAEVQKMEHLLNEFKEQSLEDEFCKKLARVFNRSSGRAGKPAVKFKVGFRKIKDSLRSLHITQPIRHLLYPKLSLRIKSLKIQKCLRVRLVNRFILCAKDEDLSKLEFEARSVKDGAWYDVDTFLSHRFLNSGDIEVRVRYVGFGAEEDEWVNARESVRVRSVALEPSECQKVNVGDLVVCFQERVRLRRLCCRPNLLAKLQ